jgi:hypothetical protein
MAPSFGSSVLRLNGSRPELGLGSYPKVISWLKHEKPPGRTNNLLEREKTHVTAGT